MSAFDYEKIADEVEIPGQGREGEKVAGGPTSPETEKTIEPDEAFTILRKDREYLSVSHPKYQGIAGDKGYKQGEDFSGKRLVRTHYSHEAMIDVILAEPTITQNELAKRFDRSVSWMSIVMGSDAFQAALAKRRDDIIDPFLVATIEERFRGLATQSLEVLAEKLETTRSADLALKALDISSKALGFGARTGGPGTQVQNNFVVQLPAQIADAKDWANQHSGRRVIEG